MYKAVLILGPGLQAEYNNFQKLYDKKDYCIIGDGNNFITYHDILTLKGKIDHSTVIHLIAHGIDKANNHAMQIRSSELTDTKHILKFIQQMAPASPLNIDMSSCFGGLASKDVNCLNEGSVLVTHAPDDNVTYGCYSNPMIFEKIQNLQNKGQNNSPYQEFLNNFTANSITSSTISTKINGKVQEFSLKLDLKTLINDENFVNAKINSFKEFYCNLHNSVNSSLDKENYPFLSTTSLIEDKLNNIEHLKLGVLQYLILINEFNIIEQEFFNENTCKNTESIIDNKFLGTNALISAVSQNSAKIAKLLLEHRADPNQIDDNGNTPLYTAISNGNYVIVEMLLKHGADVNYLCHGSTPLQRSCSVNSYDIANLLIMNGANCNSASDDEYSPLIIASEIGNYRMAKLLIHHGANPEFEASNGATPLFAASFNEHNAIIDLLGQYHDTHMSEISGYNAV